jgi:hypothetical protein
MSCRALSCIRPGNPWLRAAGLSLLFLTSSAALQAQAAPYRHAAADLEGQTLALARAAGEAGRALAASPEMRALAAARHDEFYRLVHDDPAEAMRIAMPARLRARLPDDLKAFVEERRELTGTLSVRYEHLPQSSRLVHELDTGGRRVTLHFTAPPPAIPSGARVRARGVMIGDAMALAPGDSTSLMNLDEAASSDTNTSDAPAPLSNTLGEQRVLVLLVNWQDNPTEQPFSLEHAHELVFGSVSEFYLENSFRRTWLAGEVHGWFTLPLDRPTDSTTCKHSAVAAAAQDAALAAGVDLSTFDRLVYVFPQTSCFPSGTATVGGQPSEAWINGGFFTLKTVAHELGHNLGLFHAGGLDCGTTTLGEDCLVAPYGDTMDAMANRYAGHFNPYMKERLGWLDSHTGTIVTAAADGPYRLEIYQTMPGGLPKALKVFKELVPDSGDATWYYLEYRQAFGFDAFLADNANVLNGFVVRMATETATPPPVSSLLLDMTPGSDSYDDRGDPALPFGQTFTDPANGVTLTSRSGDGGSAIVEVAFGPAECLPSTPQLSVAPAAGQWVAAGAPASYDLVVANMDGEACDAAAFDISAGLPDDWTATLDQPTVLIPPGGTGQAVLTLSSAADTAEGIYVIDVSAARGDGTGEPATAEATYVISDTNANQAPLAADDFAETQQRVSVTIDVLANDIDPDGDSLTIVRVSQPGGGSVEITADGWLSYTPKGGTKGTDRFSYTVSDGLAEATAQVEVAVLEKNGGGGKGQGKKP